MSAATEARSEAPDDILESCRLVLPAGATINRWRGERRNGLGASDMSTVLGLNPWNDLHGLWMNKTLGVEVAENDRMRLGNALEPFIRDKFVRDTGIDVAECGLLESLERPHMRYTPDGLTDDGGLFEAKSTAWWNSADWDDDQVADHAEIQVQAGMYVTGRTHAWVCALVDGNPDRFHVRRVKRDERFIAAMVDAADVFWREYVLANVEPPLTAASLDWTKTTWTPKAGKVTNIGDEGLAAVKRLRAAKHAESVAARAAAEAEAVVRSMVKNGGVVKVGKREIGALREVTANRVDQDLLRADGIDPDKYKKESTYTRFFWKSGV